MEKLLAETCIVSDSTRVRSKTPSDILEEKETVMLLHKLINWLTPKEQKVVIARLEKKTLREIGTMLGLSAETIRQIERKAFQKIRIGAMDLLGYDDFEYRWQQGIKKEQWKWEEKHKNETTL